MGREKILVKWKELGGTYRCGNCNVLETLNAVNRICIHYV